MKRKSLNWSGRWDSNSRPLDPKSSALTRLRYAPFFLSNFDFQERYYMPSKALLSTFFVNILEFASPQGDLWYAQIHWQNHLAHKYYELEQC